MDVPHFGFTHYLAHESRRLETFFTNGFQSVSKKHPAKLSAVGTTHLLRDGHPTFFVAIDTTHFLYQVFK